MPTGLVTGGTVTAGMISTSPVPGMRGPSSGNFPDASLQTLTDTFRLMGVGTWNEEIEVSTPRNTKWGKYHCTIDLLFDWLGLVCFANKNKNCQLSYN